MPSKILLDSSILVEYRKGNRTDLLEAILLNSDWTPVITQTVVSEAIASFDPDFTQPCQKEGIKLFDNVDLLKNNDDPPSIWESLVNEP
ncbi:MAG: hypothetical protein IPJ40_20345 [Saprospirales bacterium]|nr:hypothetical protein [Saprospirales bacterium]